MFISTMIHYKECKASCAITYRWATEVSMCWLGALQIVTVDRIQYIDNFFF